jgi:hypothetical protein
MSNWLDSAKMAMPPRLIRFPSALPSPLSKEKSPQ